MSQFFPSGSDNGTLRRSKRLSISEDNGDEPMSDRASPAVPNIKTASRTDGRTALQNITNQAVSNVGTTRNRSQKKSRKQSGDGMNLSTSAAKRIQTRSRTSSSGGFYFDDTEEAMVNPFPREDIEAAAAEGGEGDADEGESLDQSSESFLVSSAAGMEDEDVEKKRQQEQTNTEQMSQYHAQHWQQQQLAYKLQQQQQQIQQHQQQQKQMKQQFTQQQQIDRRQKQQQQQPTQASKQVMQQQASRQPEPEPEPTAPESTSKPVTEGVDALAISEKVERVEKEVISTTGEAGSGRARWNSNMYWDNDPAMVYADEVYRHLRVNELKYRPMDNYMEKFQTDVNHSMRTILVDWLVEVAEEYKLSSQTLFLTVHFIDRALSVITMTRTNLQLLGITAMLVAAKYEEIHPPSVDAFVYIADSTYTREQVIEMEKVLLAALNFSLSCATPWEFARRFVHAGSLTKPAESLTNFICEFFLQDPNYVKYPPSVIAASGIFLASYNFGLRPWTRELERVSGYTVVDLTPCVNELQACWWRIRSENQTLKGVREKFSSEKHHKVSSIYPRKLLP